MKKKLLIMLAIIAVIIIFVLLFWKNIVYFYYDKKYDNIERIEKNLTYGEEGNLAEESSVNLNDLNVSLSNIEYNNQNDELYLEFKFVGTKQLNTVGYILRWYTEENYYGDYYMGPTSISSAQWVMNAISFRKKTYNDADKASELLFKTFNHENILEDNTMLHKITFSLPEEVELKDKVNIVLFDLNYQNVGDPNFYKATDKLTEIKYTFDTINNIDVGSHNENATLKEDNSVYVIINDSNIDNEELITDFLNKVPTTKEDLIINILNNYKGKEQKTILKFVAGKNAVNEINEKTISNIYTNAESSNDAINEISQKYGYYEIIIDSEGENYTKKLDAYNWQLVKESDETKTKITFETEQDVDFIPVICEYNTTNEK